MAVEFRSAEWLDDQHLEQTVTWLQGLNIILVVSNRSKAIVDSNA